MSILDRLLGRPATANSAPTPEAPPRVPVAAFVSFDLADPALAEFMRGDFGGDDGTVSDRIAVRNSVFYRSLYLIAGSIGMLPLHLMRRSADGKTEKARKHPLYNVLHRKPNDYQTPVEFKSWMQTMALLDRGAYALIVRGTGGKVLSLIPLKRGSVTPKLDDNSRLVFEYVRPSGGRTILQAREVFHFRSPISLDGINGLSLKDVAADTIGLANHARRAAENLMTKGMMPGGALETDQTLGEEAIETLKKSMAEEHAGTEGRGKWLVLEEGLTAKPFNSNAKDAQLSELRRLQAEEMSRFSGVPRPLLMFDETSWGSGIEQLGLYFVTYCLMVWFIIWEEAIWRMLDENEQEAADGSMLYAKFNERALLRGSVKEQGEFFAKALGSGGGAAWMKPNEVREAFDQNPDDEGDYLPRPGTTAASIVDDKPEEPPAPPRRKKDKVDEN